MTMDRWCEIHETIVKDLHGEVGGNLFALRLSLGGLAAELDRSKRLEQAEKLTQIVIATEKKLSIISDLLGSKS